MLRRTPALAISVLVVVVVGCGQESGPGPGGASSTPAAPASQGPGVQPTLTAPHSEASSEATTATTLTFAGRVHARMAQPLLNVYQESAASELAYGVHFADGGAFSFSFPYDGKTEGNAVRDLADLPGRLTFVDRTPGPGSGDWSATAGRMEIAVEADRALRVTFSRIVLTSPSGATRTVASGEVAGRLERLCFALVPNGNLTDSAGAAVLQHVPDTQWMSPFCQQHR
jgi:hypothetical protein